MNGRAGALLIVNARPWPAARFPGADALLAAQGRIVALGESRALAAAAPHAHRIDAHGGTLTPGLCDAHVHLVPWARSLRQADLRGARTRAEALARVRAALERDASARPFVGRGWDADAWEAAPDRAALDVIAPERAVLLHSHDFHTLWVNSAALAAAGVTAATRDPEGGRFERDASGAPTGVVREHAVRAFLALEEQAGPEIDDALLDAAARELHASGITMVHDFQRNAADLRRSQALSSRRMLRVLQHVGEEQIAGLEALGATSGTGDAWFRIGALKLFADGTLGSRTAAMLERFDDVDTCGMELLTRTALATLVRRAAAAGIACSVHAIGDRAVRNALDAFEACDAARALALPPRIEHAQLVSPADLPRFAALGVAASMQPLHGTTDRDAARTAWGARCETSYPWRALLDSGALLAFGSDAPVEPPVSGAALHAALTRTRAGEHEAFTSEQCVTLDEALAAFTEAPARLAGLAGVLGTLAPGAEADLVIWDRDLAADPAGGLPKARPAVTVLSGEVVHDSSGTGPRPRGPAGTGLAERER